jgi:hypothetical protein
LINRKSLADGKISPEIEVSSEGGLGVILNALHIVRYEALKRELGPHSQVFSVRSSIRPCVLVRLIVSIVIVGPSIDIVVVELVAFEFVI